MKQLLLICGSLLLFSSCKKEVEGCMDSTATNYNSNATIDCCCIENECLTDTVSFKTCVEPIIVENCTDCHFYGSTSTSTILTTYDQIKSAIDQHDLLNRIKYTSSNANMPPSGKMTDQDIAIIENWIDNGAENN